MNSNAFGFSWNKMFCKSNQIMRSSYCWRIFSKSWILMQPLNYRTNNKNMKKIFFQQIYWIRRNFEVEHDWLLTNNRNIFPYQTINLLKISLLFSVFTKGKQRNKSELVVRDMRSETRGSQFESGCSLCAEVRTMQ